MPRLRKQIDKENIQNCVAIELKEIVTNEHKQTKQFFKKILNEKCHLYKIRAQGRSVKTIAGQKMS